MKSASDESIKPDQKVNEKVSFAIEVDPEIAVLLEKLKAEYGAHSIGSVVEMLLRDLMAPEQ